jgi:hypothetical protein
MNIIIVNILIYLLFITSHSLLSTLILLLLRTCIFLILNIIGNRFFKFRCAISILFCLLIIIWWTWWPSLFRWNHWECVILNWWLLNNCILVFIIKFLWTLLVLITHCKWWILWILFAILWFAWCIKLRHVWYYL